MKQVSRFHDEHAGDSHPSGEFAKLLRDMNGISRRLDIPVEVRKRAGSVCADVASMRFCRVTHHAVIAAAALYVACREYKRPVTLRELADASGSDPRDIGRCYTKILERIHISRPELNGRGYVYHLALRHPPSEEAYKLAEAMIKAATIGGAGGRNPMTLAAASLYLACCSMGEAVTQAEVAEAAGVGEESVRECCKEIRVLAGGVTG